MNTTRTLSGSLTHDPRAFATQAFTSPTTLAAVIDHTLLRPEATRAQVLQLCREAAEHRFACAMVNPTWVPTALAALAGTGIPVGVVVGFPLGASLAATSLEETRQLLTLGAHDIDMVLNIGLLKSADPADNTAIQNEIHALAALAHDHGAILKVILETCLLTLEEKHRAADLALAAGADFLKTSTGFSTGGATPDDIALLRARAGTTAGVKASGGIRTLADARAMLQAGANRLGASAGVQILAELQGQAPTPSTGY